VAFLKTLAPYIEGVQVNTLSIAVGAPLWQEVDQLGIGLGEPAGGEGGYYDAWRQKDGTNDLAERLFRLQTLRQYLVSMITPSTTAKEALDQKANGLDNVGIATW